MYQFHPSSTLSALLKAKPFQGAQPEKAKFLFVGLDANYAANIESQSIFPKVIEYHEDGVAFWLKYGVHHPFLLPKYSGDGYKYHLNFNKIGFKPEHADQVSFVELLHFPTVGVNKLSIDDFEVIHLNWLNNLILESNVEHVFIPNSVAVLMRKTKKFSWLPLKAIEDKKFLNKWHSVGHKNIFKYLHFSNYGKFESQMQRERIAIRELIN